METLHPGLYMQEVPGEKSIEGASTSTGAFVGTATKGKVGESEFVSSWNDFTSKYGNYTPNSYLHYAVRGFFENGGTRAYISRAVSKEGAIKASATLEDEGTSAYIIVDAKTEGTWGDNLEVQITNIKDSKFDFIVSENGAVVDSYVGVDLDILEDITKNSKYVTVTVLDESATPIEANVKLEGGTDGIEGIQPLDYVDALSAFDNDPINILAVPGITDVAVHQGIISYVELRKDCFAILETPLGLSPMEARDYKLEEGNLVSAYAGLYYSWIQVADPIGIGSNPTKLIPPSGHLAGIYARTDNSRGVLKAPAGTEAVVRGAIGLEYNVNDSEQDLLNPEGVNAIRSFPGEGIIVWGARTCSSDPEYKYVPVRRSVIYIQTSILGSTRWAVFEPNDPVLWSKLTSSMEGFLRGYWTSGGLRGASEGDAFDVQCDDTTTSPEDIDNGKVYANIGIAPQKPAEFIVFRLSLRK